MVAILPLTLSQVDVRRRGMHLLGPVNLEIKEGGPLIVLGPNGSGKTTLLKACHGLMRVARGAVTWAVPKPEADMRQAYVFQTPILLRRTMLDNVAYPLRLRGMSQAEARNNAAQALENVGLNEMTDRQAHVLSGGEKQKLALARALVTKPDVLFLDEPTAHLDGRSTREIEAILMHAQMNGTKLVMATHDLGQARRLAHDIVFLLNGEIVETGPAPAFFDAPQTDAAQRFLKGDIVE